MPDENLAYYRERAEAERMRAQACTDPCVRQAHLALAKRYQHLVEELTARDRMFPAESADPEPLVAPVAVGGKLAG